MSDPANAEVSAPVQFAGFWRRLGALALDTIILMLVGGVICWVWTEQVVALGSVGRWVGFGLALLYFGLLNSRIGQGQTLGKAALFIRVVGSDGGLISVRRAFARQVVLGLPFYMNGAWLPAAFHSALPWMMLGSVVVSGGALATIYLYLFNRPSRRSLHDLATGTSVVSEASPAEAPAMSPLRGGHRIAVGVLAAMASLGPLAFAHVLKTQPFVDLVAAANALNADPSVQASGVSLRTLWTQGDATRRELVAVAQVKEAADVNEGLARRLGGLVIASSSDADNTPDLVIQLRWGFDLGLVSWSKSQSFKIPEETKASSESAQ
ncbi:MAG: RDD family protein [Xanthomonadales bacterium]|nr:RDD family protein [Xanthomonadales bacterium]